MKIKETTKNPEKIETFASSLPEPKWGIRMIWSKYYVYRGMTRRSIAFMHAPQAEERLKELMEKEGGERG